MAYSFTQSDHEFPAELQRKIHEALRPVAEMQMKRMKTSVPGNPQGGWPGIDHTRIKQEVRDARRAAIEKWNRENP